jgi:hypothetical protein
MGQYQAMDLPGPPFLKSPGAFIDGTAGGANIIYHQDLFVFQFIALPPVESFTQIEFALGPVQFVLGLGFFYPDQGPGQYGYASIILQVTAEHFRLVILPFTSPLVEERHRNQVIKITTVKVPAVGFAKQTAQLPAQSTPVLVFENMDAFSQHPLIDPRGPDAVKADPILPAAIQAMFSIDLQGLAAA